MDGGTLTVNVAALLVTLETLLLTVTMKLALLSKASVAGVMYEDEFAPLITEPFFFQTYVRGAVPVAVTLNVADCPAVTVVLAGCAVIEGATAVAVTVRIAGLLVRFPLLSVTTTVNWAPLSELVVGGVV